MTDGAVFDWPSLGDPADAIVLQIAERYLDNCDTVYGAGKHKARVVLNIRTQAVPPSCSTNGSAVSAPAIARTANQSFTDLLMRARPPARRADPKA